MPIKIDACRKFWKDIRRLHRVTKSPQYESSVDDDLFSKYDAHARVESIQQVKLVATTIVKSIGQRQFNAISDKYDRQPYLSRGWEIRKMRFATDREGKRGGLRIVFCVDSQMANIVLVLMARKADCADEKDLQDEFFDRMNEYLKQ